MADFPVTEFGPADHPEAGDEAPDFTRPLVTDEYWADVALSALAADAGHALLVFYPLNWGGKSMYWWKEIQGRGWGRAGADDADGSADAATNGEDLAVAGINVGQPFAHQRFIEERGLPYGLFADPQNGVAEKYGVVHDLDGMAGVEEPRPAVFLVDADLTVEYAWVADEWPEAPPFDEIEAALPGE